MSVTVTRNYKRDLKFIRVKDYSLIFKYGSRKFLIVYTEQGYNTFDIYEMNTDCTGYYNLVHLKTMSCMLEDLVKLRGTLPRKERGTLVYSQIDKENFCRILTAKGFFKGYFEDEVTRIQQRNEELKDEIKNLRTVIVELQNQIVVLG